MAKFAVGDLVEVISCDIPHEQYFVGMRGEVIAIGKWKDGQHGVDGFNCDCPTGADTIIRFITIAEPCFFHSHELRKLPPADDSEDPGLIRLKKHINLWTEEIKKPSPKKEAS